jgi:HYR domain
MVLRQSITLSVTSLASVTALAVLTPAASGGPRRLVTASEGGALTLQAELLVTYPPISCPAGTPRFVECFARAGAGAIRGLGSVEESYAYALENQLAGCDVEAVRVLPAPARFSVAGKGSIDLRLTGTGCLLRSGGTLSGQETFIVTGGSGRYAGASGGGTMTHISYGPPSWRGRDTWSGSVVVPGLAFDLTPPSFVGTGNITLRAPRKANRMRAAYAVKARDEVDATVPVDCRPRSGSWFKVGRTTVRCLATDTSANEAHASFVITVKRKSR